MDVADLRENEARLAHAHAAELDPLAGYEEPTAAPGSSVAEAEAPVTREPPRPPGKAPFVLAVLVLGGLLGLGGYHHWERDQRAEEASRDTVNFVPEVHTIAVQAETGPITLKLPGQTEAFDQADIFARATGYIAERKVDIGSQVKKGDLLVRIAAPDLDEQLRQARAQVHQMEAQLAASKAQVEQAKANQTLASVTNGRIATLSNQGWATQQNADQTKAGVLTSNAAVDTAHANVKVAEANLEAQQATVQRLEALTSFEKVVAPFDGVIVSRTVDVGDLVHADMGSGTPMFTISSTRTLRVSVHIPQSAAVGIHDGVKAHVWVPQLPDRDFSGTVSRSSVALRHSSRTLTTQVDVANPDNVLRAGLYVYVTFEVPRTHPAVRIPSDALIYDEKGTHVAALQPDDTVKMVPVDIARDLGVALELRSGLQSGEQVVLSPPEDLRDGMKVTVAPTGEGKQHVANRQDS